MHLPPLAVLVGPQGCCQGSNLDFPMEVLGAWRRDHPQHSRDALEVAQIVVTVINLPGRKGHAEAHVLLLHSA